MSKRINKWYKAKVHSGSQLGRTIAVPTVNLNPAILSHFPEGIYACFVRYNRKAYAGALYLGKRLVLGETRTVLEIHLLDFHKEIYGEYIMFQIKDFIRAPRVFSSMIEMQKVIAEDIERVKGVFLNEQKGK